MNNQDYDKLISVQKEEIERIKNSNQETNIKDFYLTKYHEMYQEILQERIDEINILQATYLAMERAMAQLDVKPDLALIDGNRAKDFGIPVETVIKGDSRSANIAGVKEATTDISKILRIRAACPDDFLIWSGNDEMTVPVISLGGQGVISVTSNVAPEKMQAMSHAALAGCFPSACQLQRELLPWRHRQPGQRP